MPRRYVKRVWGERMQSLAALSEHFGVSERAMALRLQHLGLRSPVPRHSPSPPTSRPPRGRYQRVSRPITAGASA